MKRSRIVVLGIVGFALLASSAIAGRQEDKSLGYSFIVPRKWKKLPFGTGNAYVVAKFESNRSYDYADAEGWTSTQKPWIEVVVLPKELLKHRDVSVEKSGKKLKVKRELPWRSFKEFLEAECRGIGGFYFSKTDSDEIHGMKVTEYQVTIDKLVDSPLRVVGWQFDTKDAIYGLVAEYLVKEEKKLGPIIAASFKSMKTFPRTGALPNSGRTGGEIQISDKDKEKAKEKNHEYTRTELKKMRDAKTKRTLDDLAKTLGRGWTAMKSKYFIAVSHANAHYTHDLLQHADTLRRWLDKNLGFLGSGYVGKTVVTVCANSDEEQQYQQSRGWFSERPEVVTYEDREGWSDWAMEELNRGIYRVWLEDKNPNLSWGAPAWIDGGIRDMVQAARSKRGRILFKFDIWDRRQMAILRHDKKLLRAEDFFKLTSDQIYGDQQQWNQVPFFVRFLLVGAGSRGRYKNVFSDYMKNLIIALDEAEADAEKNKDVKQKEPKNEAEEAKMIKDRQNSWRKKEAATLKKLFDRTFGDWSDRDWAAFDASYWHSLK